MPDYKIGRLNGRFVISWWEAGRRRRYRLDADTLGDAKREAVETIKRVRTPPDKDTIAGAWEAYRAEKQGRRIATTMLHEWKAMGPFWGAYKPSQVTVALCRAYVAQRRAAGKHDGTIWTELGHLRTVLKWKLGAAAPRVERPPKPAPRDRFLTHAEIDRLLAAPMAHHIRLAILLMLSTAARVGAILELQWAKVDFERGQIDLRVDATGPRKGRAVVPINAGLRAALTAAQAAALTPYVIEWAGQPVANIKTGFYAAVRAAGLEKVSPHVLRHTAAVHMAEAGIPMVEIAQVLGHTSPAITFRVYARHSPDALRKAVDVLDFTKMRQVR